MAKKDENALTPLFDTIRYLWRHRPGYETIGCILDTFDALGFVNHVNLTPVLSHKHKEPYGWHLVFTLPPGISSKDVADKLIHFEEQAGAHIELTPNGKLLHMDVYVTTLPDRVSYEWDGAGRKEYIPIPIGQTAKGLLVADLADMPHLFIAGTPGSGKSNALHVIATSLIATQKAIPIVIDLKKLEFSYLKKHAIIAASGDEARQVLTLLNKEMDKRLDKLEVAGCVKIQEYKGDDMPYAVLIIDELAELQDASSQELLNRLVRLSRAAGISVICSTQRPSSTIYAKFTDTRAMFAATLCFRVRDAVNSRMVLDNDRAALLPKVPGRAVWQWEDEVEVQTMYLPVGRARKLLQGIPARRVAWDEQRPKRLLPR